MKLQRILPIMLAGALAATSFSSCNPDEPSTTPTPTPVNTTLSGDVTENMTLTSDNTYTLEGYVYVKSGATLTINAGTVIKSSVSNKGALIIERGAKIMAEGTASSPIVMTSGAAKGDRRPGDWGGLIILGSATTNRSTEPTIEGGVGKQYGGTNDADNSGVLKYVRIEYAGIAAEPGSEINGISFGAVGSGTTVENVQVSFGNDDGYEFFGGTVNCKNLIAFSCLDDDFDFDFGYRGTITNAISFKNPMYADPGDASNGIEADNDGTGTGATPNTHPKLNNFTMVGPNDAAGTQANHNLGNRWRRNVEFTMNNFIIMGHQKGGFSVESDGTIGKVFSGTSKVNNCIMHSVDNAKAVISKDGPTGQTSVELLALLGLSNNVVVNTTAEVGLTDPFNISAPNFTPKAGSMAATKGAGAIQIGNDWTAGWANWTPNNNDY